MQKKKACKTVEECKTISKKTTITFRDNYFQTKNTINS